MQDGPVAIIDPNKAPLRRPAKGDRDLMIAASNSWILAFDNLSGVKPDLSDCLCTLATGGGFATRELFTDVDEKLFDAMRPVMINGINDLAVRSDLLDRAINLTLPVILEDQRRDEDELWRRFYEIRIQVLGALLDAVAMGLRNIGSVHMDQKSRMADFAVLIVAAEPALGWPEGSFLEAYMGNRAESNVHAIEASPVGSVILALMDGRTTWTGTCTELLADLEKLLNQNNRDYWPKTAQALGNALRRLAPNLRAQRLIDL